MAEKSIVQLIKSFDLSQLKPVVFIYGSEELLKKQLIDRLKINSEVHFFWGDETSYNQLREVFFSSSLFSEGNVAVLMEFEYFVGKLSKEELTDFGSFLKNIKLPDRIFLVSRKEKLPSKEPYKTIKSIADIVVSNKLTPKAFLVSVKKKIESAGKKIDDETLKYLVSLLGNDLWTAKQEVEKLILYVGERQEITLKDVEQIIAPKISQSVFVFLDKFFQKSPDVVKVYRELTDTTYHPFEIQSLLLNHVNKLLLFKTMLKKGKTEEAAFSQIGVNHPAMKGTIKKHSSYIKQEELINIIKELYNVEKMQKIDFLDIKESFEQFLIKQVTSG